MAETRKAPPKYAPHRCSSCGQTRQTLNGAWLRWKRERAGVGLRELARRCGLSAPFLSDIERGNRHATPRAEAAYTRYLTEKPHVLTRLSPTALRAIADAKENSDV